MLEKLIKRLQAGPPSAPADARPFERCELAVAALLVEAAHIDRQATDAERATVVALLRERFRLSDSDAQTLAGEAKRHYDETLDDWIFAHTVRDCFDAAERAEVIRMLWQVVYEDSRLSKLEFELLNRLAAALDVDETMAERARIEAFAAVHPQDQGQADEP